MFEDSLIFWQDLLASVPPAVEGNKLDITTPSGSEERVNTLQKVLIFIVILGFVSLLLKVYSKKPAIEKFPA